MATTSTIAFPDIGEVTELDADATVRLPRFRPATVVHVERGTVLVTQEGDLEDHVLVDGDELVLRAEGLAVAWAFTDAVLAVGAAAPARHRSHRPALAA
jgi:hypothetical protein